MHYTGTIWRPPYEADSLLLEVTSGCNWLTIGLETCDNNALAFMNKDYTSDDALIQCRRLKAAGIEYGFFYLTISTTFAAMGASNLFQLYGHLSQAKDKLLSTIDKIIFDVGEEKLRHYRKNIPHL